jgi:hypothetical protein
MVALLALAGPDNAASMGDSETGVTTEQVESEAVNRTLDRRAEEVERSLEIC